jgi:hypothetical protein
LHRNEKDFARFQLPTTFRKKKPKRHNNFLSMKGFTITSILLVILSLQAFSQNTPLWLRYPAISPDGTTILFNYQGDIYRVSSEGGDAIPVTLSESYDYSAVWES